MVLHGTNVPPSVGSWDIPIFQITRPRTAPLRRQAHFVAPLLQTAILDQPLFMGEIRSTKRQTDKAGCSMDIQHGCSMDHPANQHLMHG